MKTNNNDASNFFLQASFEETVLQSSHVSYRSAQAMVLNYLAYRFYDDLRCESPEHDLHALESDIADFNKLPRRLSEGNHRSYAVLQEVAHILSLGKCAGCARGATRTAVGLSDF